MRVAAVFGSPPVCWALSLLVLRSPLAWVFWWIWSMRT